MGKLNLSELQPGMVLAEPVKDPQGRIVLGAGAELTERHLQVFTNWGVTEAAVEGVERADLQGDPGAGLPPETVAEIDADIARRFPANPGPVLSEIRRLSRGFKLQRVAAQVGGEDE